MATSHYLNQWWLCFTRPQWVNFNHIHQDYFTGDRVIIPVPVKHPWSLWLKSYVCTNITKTKQYQYNWAPTMVYGMHCICVQQSAAVRATQPWSQEPTSIQHHFNFWFPTPKQMTWTMQTYVTTATGKQDLAWWYWSDVFPGLATSLGFVIV